MEYLMNCPFPGNVRELENLIATAVLLETGKQLSLTSIPSLERAPSATHPPTQKILALADVEKQQILKALEAVEGNRTRAAKLLGIGLRTLRRKLNQYADETTRSI